MTVLRNAGITLKLNKFKFFTDTVKYLCQIIRLGRLMIEQVRVKSLAEVQDPQTQTELCSFLGLVRVYRQYIPNFWDMSAPLNALLCKDQPPRLDPFTTDQ